MDAGEYKDIVFIFLYYNLKVYNLGIEDPRTTANEKVFENHSIEACQGRAKPTPPRVTLGGVGQASRTTQS